jgi:phenylpropionate dioxygenase-like ring-hydroxylating dioxygenase large terminal subunit
MNLDDIERLVEPGRVHRRVYTDPEIFDLEMDRIFGRVWVFVGHESQVPKPGDWMRGRMGARQIIVTRDESGKFHVLDNRCAHRGMRVCIKESGHSRRLVCPYHGWSYHHDGALAGVPAPRGYAKSADLTDPAFALNVAPRVDSYRGFIFASQAPDGPGLAEFLGDIAAALDNVADRAPDGEVAFDGGVVRQEFAGNWKMHMENACDLVHPGFVHASAVDASRDHIADAPAGSIPQQAIQMFAGNGISLEEWDELGVYGFENGHCYMDGFYRGGMVDPGMADPVFIRYHEIMVDRYGADRTNEILDRDTFNNLIYPNISINTRFQQFRVIQPIAVDRTHIYSYSMRLKGAPQEMFEISVRFVSTANSPSSPISSDDFVIFEGVQAALADGDGDWIDFSRRLGDEQANGNAGVRDNGTSELPMRAQLNAWRNLMCAP